MYLWSNGCGQLTSIPKLLVANVYRQCSRVFPAIYFKFRYIGIWISMKALFIANYMRKLIMHKPSRFCRCEVQTHRFNSSIPTLRRIRSILAEIHFPVNTISMRHNNTFRRQHYFIILTENTSYTFICMINSHGNSKW